MYKKKHDNLRQFRTTVTTNNNKGDIFDIYFGYNISKTNPIFYVKASINGSSISASKKTLRRIQKLNIEPINQLISLIGCDYRGIKLFDNDKTIESEIVSIIKGLVDESGHISEERYDNIFNLISESMRLTLESEQQKLTQLLSKAKTLKAHNIRKWFDSHRVRLLTEVRNTVKSLYGLTKSNDFTVDFLGYISDAGHTMYYKRDTDMLRLHAIDLYTTVLKKEYVPFA